MPHEELRQRLEDFRLKDSELRVRIEALIDQIRQDEGLELEEVEQVVRETFAAKPKLVDVNLEALRRNLARVREVAPGCRVITAIKADGYGKDAVEAVRLARRFVLEP